MGGGFSDDRFETVVTCLLGIHDIKIAMYKGSESDDGEKKGKKETNNPVVASEDEDES